MANNFKPWGSLTHAKYEAFVSFPAANNVTYVGKSSPAGTGAGTAESPLNSLQVGYAALQVGTGQYSMTAGCGSGHIEADGYVVVRGPGTGDFMGRGRVIGLDLSGFEFLMNTTSGSGGNNWACVLQCIVRGMGLNMFNDINVSNHELMDTILLSSPVTIYSTGYLGPTTEHVAYNLFINSPANINGSGAPFCCYFDANSPLTVPAHLLPQNCNIRGALTIAGVPYASLAAAAVDYPQLLTTGNINADPQFNRAAAEDFTLKLSSPHLDLGIGPRHLRYALMYYIEFDGIVGELCTVGNTRLRSTADGSAVLFTAIDGFTVNEQGALVIVANSSGNYEGSYTTGRIRVAATAQPIESIPVIFQANFDTDYPTTEAAFSSVLPEVYNNNVPAYANHAAGSIGRNPRRLTVRARFSPNLNPDITQSGDWALGVWMEYEIGQRPTYNAATGTGNGSPSFDYSAGAATQMVARWVQLSYRARNNYYSR